MSSTHRTKLFKGYSPVTVFVCVNDGFVDNLLKLGILEVVPHHHLQDLEELTVGYVAVLVHVVDSEGNCEQEEIGKPFPTLSLKGLFVRRLSTQHLCILTYSIHIFSVKPC